ncbi:MAG: hypothetical protein K2X47_12705 [Bdellovibrionales bacterium]|nr:hypothetical protein [Bdellovibrionales bacterium]
MEKSLIPLTLAAILVQLFGLMVEFEIINPFGWRNSHDVSSQVGVVERKERQVRRRSSSSPLWEETEKLSPLWNYDSVLTLKESSARLSLKGGTQIDLSENTLVVIDPTTESEDAPLRLRFFKGELKALVKARNQEIQTKQWIVEPTPGADIKVTSLNSENLEVEVNNGQVNVFPSDGSGLKDETRVIALNSGQRVEIQGSNVTPPYSRSNDLKWKTGEHDHVRIYSHAEPVEIRLEWEGEAAELEWLKNSEEGEPLQLKAGQSHFFHSVPYGVYRARLKTKDNRESSTLKVEVWKAAKHYLTSPLPRDRAKTKHPLLFAWTPNPIAETYRLSLATRRTSLITVSSPKESASLSGTEEGTFWWQVEAIDSQGFVIPPHYKQEISLLENPLAPPELIGPAIRSPGSAR